MGFISRSKVIILINTRRNLLSYISVDKLIGVDFINVMALSSVWILMVILVNPIGNFPLNDDWAYSYSVKVLLEQGDFQLSGWTATNLFSQVFWGALFSLPFGFSFTALRFSTLTLSLLGLLATYGLLREIKIIPILAFLGTGLVAINPIYFGLSHTFMNDVQFAGIGMLSLYFLLRGLKHEAKVEIGIGLILSCFAILSRQSGLAIPLAFGAAYIIKKGLTLPNVMKASLPAVLGFFIQIAYQGWLQLTLRTPLKYGNQIKTLYHEIYQGLDNVIFSFSTISLFALVYLGLFLAPFLFLLFLKQFTQASSRQRNISVIVTGGFLIMITIGLLWKQALMPLHGNILVDLGIGPTILNNSHPQPAPRMFWLIITVIGALGAALILQNLLFAVLQLFKKPQPASEDQRWMAVFILAVMSVYAAPLGFLGIGPFGFYDRYLVFLVPLLVLLTALPMSRLNWQGNKKLIALPIVMILLYGGFTIAATHDYLSWNRARWEALHNLMDDDVPPDRIDGGFEFNAWYLYDDGYEYDPNKSWYWVDRDDYVVSFYPLDGYTEINRYPYETWLPGEQGNILVLQK